MAQKDAAIKHLKTDNSLLKHTSKWCEITHLKCSKAKTRSVHKRNEQLYQKRKVWLKRNNVLLHEKNIAKEQDKRLVEKNQNKGGLFRRKLQKTLQGVANGKAQLHDEFP